MFYVSISMFHHILVCQATARAARAEYEQESRIWSLHYDSCFFFDVHVLVNAHTRKYALT